MKTLTRVIGGALLFSVIFMAGCASPARTAGPFDSENPSWRGRLALRIDSEQPQSFSAGFELTGTARTGALVLTSPLGNTLAALNWTPDSAVMRANGELRRFDSLDALLQTATGAAIPIATLFAWLQGDNASAPGWLADLTQLDAGRLVARRTEPAPPVELRLVLEP